MKLQIFPTVVLLMLTGACGGGDGQSAPLDARPAQPDAAIPAPAAKLTLAVAKAQRIQRIGFLPGPAIGNVFVGVQLSLVNSGEARPLPVTESSFSIKTSANVFYQQSPLTLMGTNPCPRGAAVASTGTLSCQTIFEIPRAAVVNGLLYADDTGRQGAAEIAMVESPEVLCTRWAAPFLCESCCTSCIGRIPATCSREQRAMDAACANEDMAGCVIHNAVCPGFAVSCTASVACKDAVDLYQGCAYDDCGPICL